MRRRHSVGVQGGMGKKNEGMVTKGGKTLKRGEKKKKKHPFDVLCGNSGRIGWTI